MWNLIGYANAAFWTVMAIEWIQGNRQMGFLRDLKAEGTLPHLSIIIPACNEATRLANALTSVCTQSYPHVQIILVNDRSTDATGQVAESVARQYPHVQVIHVTELPPGWLGKNHALYVGSQRATGEYVLFTDADVHYAPGSLAAAVTYAQKNNVDHLIVLPQNRARTFVEKVILNCFAFLFALRHNPWRCSNPDSRYYLGIGAFNLVRRDVYQDIGTHAAFPMDVLDDVELGRQIKASGYRQQALYGTDAVTMPWYDGAEGAASGFTKNFFSTMHYNFLWALAAVVGLILFGILPFVGIWFSTGYSQLAYIIALAGILIVFTLTGQVTKIPLLPYVLGTPFGIAVCAWILMQSAVTAYRTRGIAWRGTVYSLMELRRARRIADQLVRNKLARREATH